jgi:hypothetical protein
VERSRRTVETARREGIDCPAIRDLEKLVREYDERTASGPHCDAPHASVACANQSGN